MPIRTGRDLREHLDVWRREQAEADHHEKRQNYHYEKCKQSVGRAADLAAVIRPVMSGRLGSWDRITDAELDGLVERHRRQQDEAKRPRVAMPLADGVALFEEVPKRIATDGEVRRLLTLAENHPAVGSASAGTTNFTCDECGNFWAKGFGQARLVDGRLVCLACLPTLEVGPAAVGDSDVAMMADAAADDGIPRTGRELFRWAKEQEQRYETGLLKYLNCWAKLNGFPGLMVDWNTESVTQAYAEARRKLGVDGPTTVHVATLVEAATDETPVTPTRCPDCNGTGVSPDTIDGPEPDQTECLLCCGYGCVTGGGVAQRADAAEFPELAGIAAEIGGQS